MKCPQCRKNQQYRSGMKCLKCGYRFALDPKSYGCADGKFLWMIRRASCDGTVFFTMNQLVAAFRTSVRGRGCMFGLAILFLIVWALFWINYLFPKLLQDVNLPIQVVIGAGIPFGLFFLIWKFGYRGPSAKHVRELVSTYEDHTKKRIPKLLLNNRMINSPPPHWDEDDIYDYGVEGILFVQTELLADLLVLNRFHIDNRIAIVTANGYPEYIVPQIQKIIDSQPNVPLFALHHASKRDDNFARSLSGSSTFKIRKRDIIDLGFSLSDVRSNWRLKRHVRDGAMQVDDINWKALAPALALAIQNKSPILIALAADSDTAAALATTFG